MADDENVHGDFEFFRYNPSTAGNVVFVVLFAVPAAAHAYMLVKRKTWYFLPFLIGCLCKSGGAASSSGLDVLTLPFQSRPSGTLAG